MGILTLSFLLPAIMQNFMSRYIQSLRLRYITHASMLRIDIFLILMLEPLRVLNSNKTRTCSAVGRWSVGKPNSACCRWFQKCCRILISAIILYLINPWLVLLAIVGGLPLCIFYRKNIPIKYINFTTIGQMK